MPLILTAAVLALAGCGGHAAPRTVAPRSVGEVERAFAAHGIRLQPVQPAVGAPLRYGVLFGQSGTLSVSVRVYSKLRAEHSAPGTRSVRNVVATWQGADRPSVEAAMDALR